MSAELSAIEAKFLTLGWNVPDEVETARNEADQKLWARLQNLPDSQFKIKRLPRPEKGWATIARPRGSLLRMEVKPDDVVDWNGGWEGDAWGGASSLSEEIAKLEAERAADGIPPLAPLVSVFADDDWGDVTELGACEDVLSTESEVISEPSTAPEAPAVQDSKKKENLKTGFEPPHRKHHYRQLRERAQQAVQDKTSGSSKHKTSEPARPRRCYTTPLM